MGSNFGGATNTLTFATATPNVSGANAPLSWRVSLNLDGTRNTEFASPFPSGTDIKKVYGYNNQIYVLIDGYFTPIRLNPLAL
mgnify:CR=1 FL=1